jgi:hypothetical protein
VLRYAVRRRSSAFETTVMLDADIASAPKFWSEHQTQRRIQHLEQVELATAESVDWWNHRRLHGAIRDMSQPSLRRSTITNAWPTRRVIPSR